MNITIKKAIFSYLEYEKSRVKPQSFYKIKNRIDMYIIPFYDQQRLVSEINTSDYLNYQNKIDSLGLSYGYKKTIHYLNVAIFNHCMKFYNLTCNVASQVGNFKDTQIKKDIIVWSTREYKRFIKHINKKDLIYKRLYEFLFYTGVRLGEALALTFEDLKKDTVYINKTITKENYNGERIITTPKTKKSIRKIQIDLILRIKIHHLKKYYSKHFDNFATTFYIFGGNSPLAPTTIERKKNVYCKIAKVPQIRIHDFRHCYATNLISKGVPVNVVSSMLGHSNISMTFDTYTHVLNRDKKRVLKTLYISRLF